VPSPPPVHNFVNDPKVPDYPYDFSGVVARALDKSRGT
jgi:cytochrome c oxidase subunit 1